LTDDRQALIMTLQLSLAVSSQLHLARNSMVLNQPDSGKLSSLCSWWIHWHFGDTNDPSLEQAAKKHSTCSAASVPDGSLFQSLENLLRGKRSSLASHRANWLTFIIDYYNTIFTSNFDMSTLVVCFGATCISRLLYEYFQYDRAKQNICIYTAYTKYAFSMKFTVSCVDCL